MTPRIDPVGPPDAPGDTEPKPMAAQRERAKVLLHAFGISPNYQLSYTEALNAMTLFALNEARINASRPSSEAVPPSTQEPT